MVEVLQCEACQATLDRGRITGYCPACNRQHCPQCVRICDACLRNFCMFDISLKEVWRNYTPKTMKLCGMCKGVWM